MTFTLLCRQACAQGHAEIVQALVSKGKVDTSLLNDVGLTGWQLAQQMRRKDVEKVLLHYASKPKGGANTNHLRAESLVIPAIV